MAQLSANYETVMVLSLKNGEDDAKALAEKFQKLIADNGTIGKIDTWGQRTLAYPMNGVVVEFSSKPDFPAELDRVYKITDGVLRSLIVTKEPEEAA